MWILFCPSVSISILVLFRIRIVESTPNQIREIGHLTIIVQMPYYGATICWQLYTLYSIKFVPYTSFLFKCRDVNKFHTHSYDYIKKDRPLPLMNAILLSVTPQSITYISLILFLTLICICVLFQIGC